MNNTSLHSINQTVDTNKSTGLKKFFSFLGPAYMVSVGYMDPGNWATDIAGGSQFGYKLIWVLLMSNLIAQLLQSLSARLGLVSGLDLAQASRKSYNKGVNICLYVLAEIAIAACDLAEVIGMAIGLKLLFGMPLMYGVLISVLDTFLLLVLLNYGVRKLEAFIIALVTIIGVSFLVQMLIAQPVLTDVMQGFIPTALNHDALYISIGIIGATVMPHNLYLHSSLVQTRKFERTIPEIKKAIKYNLIDSTIALNVAFFINAALLILAAATFYKVGMHQVSDLQEAHRLLQPILGSKYAPMLFAIALIAAGQSSTITGTLAGQIVMEGHINLRMQPWVRRIITRMLAVIPALFVLVYYGESKATEMLIGSQVILSLQLGFAVIPLIRYVSSKTTMNTFAISLKTKITAWVCAAIIVALNLKLVGEQLETMYTQSIVNPILFYVLILPLALAILGLLVYITFIPLKLDVPQADLKGMHSRTDELELHVKPPYKNIAIAVDFSNMDDKAVSHAIAQGGLLASYTLIHVVETVGALVFGKDVDDKETQDDLIHINAYIAQLQAKGYTVNYKLSFGSPKKAIPTTVNELNCDLLVMGVHGHNTFMDLILGTTVETVRHNIKVPLLIVN
ncbi:MAG: Nramp family divalent metal transporter [Bacteroidia bacterium]